LQASFLVQRNLVSTPRWLSRFLDYPAINVREWYQPISAAMAASPVAMSGKDPSDRGWDQSWLWSSGAPGQTGLTEASDLNCIGVGQTCSWSQQCAQAIGLTDNFTIRFS
jgi:hypothetical protein